MLKIDENWWVFWWVLCRCWLMISFDCHVHVLISFMFIFRGGTSHAPQQTSKANRARMGRNFIFVFILPPCLPRILNIANCIGQF